MIYLIGTVSSSVTPPETDPYTLTELSTLHLSRLYTARGWPLHGRYNRASTQSHALDSNDTGSCRSPPRDNEDRHVHAEIPAETPTMAKGLPWPSAWDSRVWIARYRYRRATRD